MDNVFIERLWRSLKYEYVYLHEFENRTEARNGIREWIEFYNSTSEHPSLYVVEENRFC
jgi:putative transposase